MVRRKLVGKRMSEAAQQTVQWLREETRRHQAQRDQQKEGASGVLQVLRTAAHSAGRRTAEQATSFGEALRAAFRDAEAPDEGQTTAKRKRGHRAAGDRESRVVKRETFEEGLLWALDLASFDDVVDLIKSEYPSKIKREPVGDVTVNLIDEIVDLVSAEAPEESKPSNLQAGIGLHNLDAAFSDPFFMNSVTVPVHRAEDAQPRRSSKRLALVDRPFASAVVNPAPAAPGKRKRGSRGGGRRRLDVGQILGLWVYLHAGPITRARAKRLAAQGT